MPKKLKPIFVGTVNKGDIDIPATISIDTASESSFTEYAKKFKDNEKVKIVVSRLTKRYIRSVEQNAYYWGVVIKILCDELGYRSIEREDLHEELKAMFLVYIGKLGSPVVEKTSKLDTKTFERYLKAIRDWALDFHGIKIPLPNETDVDDTYIRI